MSASSEARHLPVGFRIVSARGVPGTLGAIGHTLHDGQPVLLSTWHVLFGHDSADDGEVSLAGDTAIGRALYGKLGTVRLGGEEYHVDCAIASYPHIDVQRGVRGHAWPSPGQIVTKTGAATGTTSGAVVSVDASENVTIDGRTFRATRQLLIRSLDRASRFSAEGDSGALVVDAAGNAVGLLWGVTTDGDAVACPIAPVLYAMNITLAAEHG